MAFKPVISSNSEKSNLNQINDMVRSLNKEQQVKTFNGSTGDNAVLIGKYADGRYGLVISDLNGAYRRILIGQHPTDGRPGVWVSNESVDVVTELS
jgi:hypothetical protein